MIGLNMTKTEEDFLYCLRSSLFMEEVCTPSNEVLEEATQQAVLPLVVSGIKSYPIIAKNVQIIHEQKQIGELLGSIPYVVLKGTAAAVYYPEPIRRTLGDIDIIVRPEDFGLAYQILINAGYNAVSNIDKVDRETILYQDGSVVELHKTYAELNKKDQEKQLDQLIFDGILQAVERQINNQTFPMLPEPINGIVLLAHISQHMETGLGFRQLIDWIMYVNCELHDDAWPSFKEITDKLGLTKLAMVATRTGQLYLGLSEEKITWCREVDELLCQGMLNYLFECGNFGRKLGANNRVIAVFSQGKNLKSFFINLQQKGEAAWTILDKHRCLKPFAWIYQSIRLAFKGLKSVSISDIQKDYKASKARNRLMEELEVKQLTQKNENSKNSHD